MSRHNLSASTAARSIRSLIEQAGTAPNVQEHITPGFDEPRFRMPVVPGVVGTVSMNGEQVPAATAAAAMGIYYPPLEPGQPGTRLSFSALMAMNSQFIRAGGNLIVANSAPAGSTVPGEINLYNRPEKFRIINQAVFSLLGDGLSVANSPYPVQETEVKLGSAANYSTAFIVTRRQQKDLPTDLVALEVAFALAKGVARLVDEVALGAIADAAGPFSFAAMAARDIRAEELRAVVGTSGTGFAFRADGTPAVQGMPADFTAAIPETVAGAFNRAAIMLSDDIYVVLKRLSVEGDLEVAAHVNARAAVPEVGFFGLVA